MSLSYTITPRNGRRIDLELNINLSDTSFDFKYKDIELQTQGTFPNLPQKREYSILLIGYTDQIVLKENTIIIEQYHKRFEIQNKEKYSDREFASTIKIPFTNNLFAQIQRLYQDYLDTL